MVDILHRVGAEAPLAAVHQAIATPEGVAGWWASGATGESTVGGKLAVEFADEEGRQVGAFDVEIEELEPRRVTWRVLDGAEEWIDTRIRFDLKETAGFTIVEFAHLGWKEPGPFMAHCTTKWGTFLMSLKELVETGTGRPAPHDVKISDWH